MVHKRYAVYGLSLLAIAGGAAAQDEPTVAPVETAADFFRLADEDGNGKLTPTEYEPVNLGYSHREVSGQDGELTEAEYRDAFGNNVFTSLSGLRHLDEDGSETLSREEYGQGELALSFDSIDANGDDSINKAEFSLALARLSSRDDGNRPEEEAATADESEARTLQARARANGGQLSGRALLSTESDPIGKVELIVEHEESGELYAIVSSDEGNVRKLSSVALKDIRQWEDALIYDHPDAAGKLREQEYDGSRFRRLDQPQADSLQQDAGQSMSTALLLEPALLNDVRLVDSEGQEVGRVAKLAVNKQDQKLYALTTGGGPLSDGGEQMAVPVSALRSTPDGVVLSAPEEARTFRDTDYLMVEELDLPLE